MALNPSPTASGTFILSLGSYSRALYLILPCYYKFSLSGYYVCCLHGDGPTELDENLILFKTETLMKCHWILQIRKEHHLKYDTFALQVAIRNLLPFHSRVVQSYLWVCRMLAVDPLRILQVLLKSLSIQWKRQYAVSILIIVRCQKSTNTIQSDY